MPRLAPEINTLGMGPLRMLQTLAVKTVILRCERSTLQAQTRSMVRRPASGKLGLLPPPLAGEGWGGGMPTRFFVHAPSLSLPRKRGREPCGTVIAINR